MAGGNVPVPEIYDFDSNCKSCFLCRMNWDDLHYEKTTYEPFRVYSQSKLANVLFSAELGEKTTLPDFFFVKNYP